MLFGILFYYAGILFQKALINTFGAVSTFLSPQKSPEESSSRETWWNWHISFAWKLTVVFIFTQVYVADIEGHENTRSTLNESAYYVISKAGGTPYAGAVAEKQKHLNDRWRALCQQLGITYKKAEETRYGLKLLEIQLKQLNTWMAEVETKLREFSVVGSCILPELQRKVKEMKVIIKMSEHTFSLFLLIVISLCRSFNTHSFVFRKQAEMKSYLN